MQKTVTATTDLQQLYAPILDDLNVVKRVFDDELACDLPFVGALCDTVRSYRGKMLRPAVLLLTARACGSLTKVHHTLAAVVEMVHMATLVHDDVLDAADERRRQPTIAAIRGNEAAVLLGDFLISHAYHLCSSLDSQFASRRIAAATNTVCEGELLQNHHRGNLQLGEADYFDIISRKTGALTAVATELGAAFAETEGTVVKAMRQFGDHLGVAFQIIDDVLDLTGDSREVGKSLGRDAAMGTLTLPMIHALANASSQTVDALRSALTTNESPDRSVVCRLLNETGSIDYAVSAARTHTARAIEHLDTLPPSDARSSLTAMTEFIVDRRH